MAEGKILPYLDVPFQHASPRILKAMKRPASAENTLERIRKWREICPEITIRSTFITGFPGETEKISRSCSSSSKKPSSTASAPLPTRRSRAPRPTNWAGCLPEDVREDRRRWLMQVQEDISAAKLAAKIDRVIEVLVDEVDEEGTIARSKADAPEIDGLVYLDGHFDAQPGDFLQVRVIDADHHDLYAAPYLTDWRRTRVRPAARLQCRRSRRRRSRLCRSCRRAATPACAARATPDGEGGRWSSA
jgi:ribosomal protein S12 methylthiotransferase